MVLVYNNSLYDNQGGVSLLEFSGLGIHHDRSKNSLRIKVEQRISDVKL